MDKKALMLRPVDTVATVVEDVEKKATKFAMLKTEYKCPYS